MRRTPALLSLAAAGALAAAATGLSVPSATAATPGTVALTGAVIDGLSKQHALGPADPAQSLSITVTLTPPDPAGEAKAFKDLYDPASSSYEQWLTPPRSPTASVPRWGPSPR